MSGHLILVGMMGAGKSTVGRHCAERLGRNLVDTDDLVEAGAAKSIAAIFAEDGEARFRELERTAVADVCASPAPLVIACGGGVVLDPGNRRLLRDAGFVVWLHAPAAVLASRVGRGEDRPLLRGDPVGTLARLDKLREPAYEASAHCRIDTDGLGPEAVADAVLAAYEGVRA